MTLQKTAAGELGTPSTAQTKGTRKQCTPHTNPMQRCRNCGLPGGSLCCDCAAWLAVYAGVRQAAAALRGVSR